MTYQLTTPLLDACVLAILNIEDAYGYTLTQKVKEVVDISESTLYPVLRRLQKDNYLSTYDEPFQGRNRRYYHITILCCITQRKRQKKKNHRLPEVKIIE